MSAPFTAFAIERLAQCLRIDVELDDEVGAAEPLTTRADAIPGTSLAAWDIGDIGHELLGLSDSRDYGFLGLIELAAEAGYVDLKEWEGTPIVARAAGHVVLASETAVRGDEGSAEDPRLGLVRRLAAWPADPPHPARDRDPVAFAAFESYLALTDAVFADAELIETLHFVHSDWTPGADRGALLTPRHMADAIATGQVGAVKVRGIAGMPSVFDAYDWLVSIVARLKDRPELRDGLLVHARWSHAAWLVRQRADEWAMAMSEWSPQRDLDGEARWEAFRERVFKRLEGEQGRLDLERTENGQVKRIDYEPVAWVPEVPIGHVRQHVDELVAAGRDEAARRTLRAAMVQLVRQYNRDDEARKAVAERLVAFGRVLGELGDADSAAALVAPQLSFLLEKVGRGYEMTEHALELVARAKRAEAETVAAPEQSIQPPRPTGAPTEERPKLRARGETG